MFKKIIQFILVILFLPPCYYAGLILYEEISGISNISGDQLYFFYGCIFYLIFHAVAFKPDKLYIFAHEVMHAIATVLSGGKVHSIRVSGKGGSVKTNKSNAFITLAPYLFPFYTILAAIVYFVLVYFKKDAPMFSRVFLFIVGATLTFHIVLTINFLKIKQTDLSGTGYFFSMQLIYLVNVMIVALIFNFLFREVDFRRFASSAFAESKKAYIDIFRQLFL
ncbi:MAG: M50 family metallopeptidase [Candidatus Omnitrophota bacterium]